MKKFNLNKISLVIMTAVSILSLTACNDKKDDQDTIDPDAVLKQLNDKKAKETPASTPVVEQPKETVKEEVKPESKTEDKVYKLSLKNSYSLSKQSAIDSFNSKNYQMAIESLTEGLILKPYRDNVGCAIGFGFNYYFRNKNEVQTVFSSASVNQSITDKIKAVSNKNEQCIIDTSITAENARNIAKIDTERNFEPGVIKLLGKDTWDKLSENEKGVLRYAPQKAGLGGFAKFKTLIANIKTYASNKTDANRQKVIDSLVFHYKVKDKDGQWVEKTDTRSHLLMGAMFTSPETFASILGTSGADTSSFVKVAKSQNINIDSSKSIEDQVNENDELNKALSEVTNPEVQMLDESNKPIDLQKSFETTPAQIVEPKQSSSGVDKMSQTGAMLFGGAKPEDFNKSKVKEQPKPKGNKSDLESAVGSNANDLASKGYTGRKLSNGMIEVTPPSQAEPKVSRKNQVCQKSVIIQGQQVTVPVPCEQ